MWDRFELSDLGVLYLLIAVVCLGLWLRRPQWSNPPRFNDVVSPILFPVIVSLIWPIELALYARRKFTRQPQ